MNVRNFEIRSPNATGWRESSLTASRTKSDLAAELEQKIWNLDRQTHRHAFEKDSQ